LTLACQGIEDIFRASVFKMLKDEGKINDDTINKLMGWRLSCHKQFVQHLGSVRRQGNDLA
jgi:hypothetical protein